MMEEAAQHTFETAFRIAEVLGQEVRDDSYEPSCNVLTDRGREYTDRNLTIETHYHVAFDGSTGGSTKTVRIKYCGKIVFEAYEDRPPLPRSATQPDIYEAGLWEGELTGLSGIASQLELRKG